MSKVSFTKNLRFCILFFSLKCHSVSYVALSTTSLARTDVAALNGRLGGTETQTNVLVPSAATLARSGALGLGLRVLEDMGLLLESTLRLDGQLGRPEILLASKWSDMSRASAVRTDILMILCQAGTVAKGRCRGGVGVAGVEVGRDVFREWRK